MPKPPIHGRDHGPGGADPIPGVGASGWQFNTENGTDGGPAGWGQLVFTDSHDGGWGELGGVFVDKTGEGAALRSQDSGNTKQGDVTVTPDGVTIGLSGAGTPQFTLRRTQGDTLAIRPLGVQGPTGATTPVRLAGGTISGAPASGTWQTNDVVVAADGHIFVCTAGGSPGTWVDLLDAVPAAPTLSASTEYLSTTTPVTIADGASANVPWDTVTAGATLLDISTPTAPTVLVDGVYGVSVGVGPSGLSVGGYFAASLNSDGAPAPLFPGQLSPPATAASISASLTLAAPPVQLSAGDNLTLNVSNFDGASSQDFFLEATVTKLEVA